MTAFEIFTPTEIGSTQLHRYEVNAQSWTDALKTALEQSGINANLIAHAVCDIRQDGIHVTDPNTRQMYLIREKSSAPAPTSIVAASDTSSEELENNLQDLFITSNEIYSRKTVNEAARFLLELSLSHISAEAGTVFLANLGTLELEFTAVSGPKARELQGMKMSVDKGIVGFCVQEGVHLAVNNVQYDEHFYDQISKRIGYETRSILCASMNSNGRTLGAIELVNRKDKGSFTEGDLSQLAYLAARFAEYLVTTDQTM